MAAAISFISNHLALLLVSVLICHNMNSIIITPNHRHTFVDADDTNIQDISNISTQIHNHNHTIDNLKQDSRELSNDSGLDSSSLSSSLSSSSVLSSSSLSSVESSSSNASSSSGLEIPLNIINNTINNNSINITPPIHPANETNKAEDLKLSIRRIKHHVETLILISWTPADEEFEMTRTTSLPGNVTNTSTKTNNTKYYGKTFSGFIVSYTILENSTLSSINNKDSSIITKATQEDHENTQRSANNINADSPISTTTINSNITRVNLVSYSDEGLEFKSPLLPTEVRSFSMHDPIPRGEREMTSLRVCVYYSFLPNSVKAGDDSTKRVCQKMAVSDSEHDNNNKDNIQIVVVEGKEKDKMPTKKMATGIVAGCIFLIPCVAVLILIWKKDKQFRESVLYDELYGSDEAAFWNEGLDVELGVLGGEKDEIVLKVNKQEATQVSVKQSQNDNKKNDMDNNCENGSRKCEVVVSHVEDNQDDNKCTMESEQIQGGASLNGREEEGNKENETFYTVKL